MGISASFFAYHMLTNLHTGFLVVAAHGVGVAVVRIVSARFWGHAVDRIGAGPVVVFCSFGIAAVPLTWFFVTPDRLWPIALDAIFAAFLWSGHNIAAFDLTIGLAPRASRPFYLAAFATAGGLGFGLASMLAGQLAALIPAHFDAGRRGVEQPARALPALRGGPSGLRDACRSACTTRAPAATSASWSARSPIAPASAPSAPTSPRFARLARR